MASAWICRSSIQGLLQENAGSLSAYLNPTVENRPLVSQVGFPQLVQEEPGVQVAGRQYQLP